MTKKELFTLIALIMTFITGIVDVLLFASFMTNVGTAIVIVCLIYAVLGSVCSIYIKKYADELEEW